MAPPNSRKRPATLQGGRSPKKANTSKTNSNHKSLDLSQKKRRQPVTRSILPDESGSDEGDDLEPPSLDIANEDTMEIDESSSHTKNPNAAKESHKVQKALASQRKSAKPHSSLLEKAKPLWSLARQKDITKEERQKHVENLMKTVRGKVQDVVFKHDASRIIQTLVKYGGQKERDEIATELKGKYKHLAQNKYAKFLVTKLIRYSPTRRSDILSEFHTHVMRLLLHRESSSILADAFELYANSAERNLLVRDFYGKEVALFQDGSLDGKGGLKATLGGMDLERRKRILGALKENLLSIFNNPEKGAVAHAIVHRALWEYITECNTLEDQTEAEKARREIFENCQELVAEMVHTKDGSHVVREFLARGNAKDRKQIIKVLKPHFERMCKDEEAQLVMFTALDVIDDTKLLTKSLVAEIINLAPTLYSEIHGRRSLLYLVVPRSPRHFTPSMIAILAQTDEIRSSTSKKDPATRADELRKAASTGLLLLVEEKGADMIRDPGGSLVVTEIMLFTEGDKSRAFDALLAPLAEHYPSESHLIDLAHASRVYKTLLQGGHYRQTISAIERSPSFSPAAFATGFLQKVGRANTTQIALGGGTFIVAELCQRIQEDGTADERNLLRDWLCEDVQKQIASGKGRGSELLLEKIRALHA